MIFAYGVSFGNDRVHQWVLSIITSFFSSLLVFQPLMVLAMIGGLARWFKTRPFDDDHTSFDETKVTLYYDPNDPTVPPQIPIKSESKKPVMEDLFYKDLKKRKGQEFEMKALLKDMTIYVCYALVVLIVSYGNRDYNNFLQKEALKTAVIHGGLICGVGQEDDPRYIECDPEDVPHREIDFMQVKHVNDWYYWLNNTVKPNVRVQEWYNGKPPYGLRGYLDDKANRIIGYAIVRQIREAPGTCRSPIEIRDAIEHCTGDGGIHTEDSEDYCVGWQRPWPPGKPCNTSEEYQYTTAAKLESAPIQAGIRRYGGGGYIFSFTGPIEELNNKMNGLVENKWIDNQTRAVILEFSVYNAQVNLFGSVTAVAEFIGGGIIPWNIVKSVRLFNSLKGFGYVIAMAETLFAVSTFYYTVSVLTKMKKEGVFQFFKNSWNIADVFTILLSLAALLLYGIRSVVVRELLKKISSTKGNIYVRITNAVLVNEYYNYVVAFTVFTTTLKFAKMIAFHKSFMQIAATFRLCFIGLSTFVVEFFIVFFAFSSFFFFTLRNDLARFRDILHSVEYTLAMSIGKFNFDSLRQADEMTAWIFFVFSITVNMILINMMMAIINLAYEEIKSNKAAYVNKFELLEYIKRTGNEMIGLKLADPIRPKYQDPNEPKMLKEDATEKTHRVASEFSNKTNQLLDYIEGTYLNGNMDPETKQYIDKMRQEHSFNPKDKKIAEYGFDALFLNK